MLLTPTQTLSQHTNISQLYVASMMNVLNGCSRGCNELFSSDLSSSSMGNGNPTQDAYGNCFLIYKVFAVDIIHLTDSVTISHTRSESNLKLSPT